MEFQYRPWSKHNKQIRFKHGIDSLKKIQRQNVGFAVN